MSSPDHRHRGQGWLDRYLQAKRWAPGLRAEVPSSEKVELGIECDSSAFRSTA